MGVYSPCDGVVHISTGCCAERKRQYMKEYRVEHGDRLRAWRRKTWPQRQYGLTDAERLKLFESSDGLCALCYEEPATVIDHDHETGRVRGALCAFCNKGLGYIEKMGATSDSIVEYLTTNWYSS